jgi:methylated-DNA-[protein]-cysteine S-methyltransferase
VHATRHRYAIDGWGVGELVLSDGVVVVHELEWGRSAALPDDDPGVDADGLAGALVHRVQEHLAGRPVSYADIPLDLTWCTDFQHALGTALQAVPWGEIVSYGELAALAGRPGAARAAGTFCAKNRFALLLPCHRVVSSDGIGGYGSSGVGLKRRLLALEGLRL